MAALPRIALTMGDPAGVGPELCLRALAHAAFRDTVQLWVFGEADVLRACAARTGLPAPEVIIDFAQEGLPVTNTRAAVIDFGAITAADFTPGKINAATGRAAFTYFDTAITAALEGQVDAITTAPINKEALAAAGIPYPGHTEILAARCEAPRACMMQYSPELTCTFVTTHVGYAEVPELLTEERLGEVLDLTHAALLRLKQRDPCLLVCGLNPHAGENGLFGNHEEETIIRPALKAAQARGLDVTGPVPPDTAFLPEKRRAYDAVVCLYHDQGHIPLKALAFDEAVNTTLGLPILRTSVDHGTALDIAWQNPPRARPGSLFAALHLALQLATNA